MNRAFPNWLLSVLLLVVVGGGLVWWVLQVSTVPAIPASATTGTTESPVNSSAVATLKQRSIYGNLPLTDQSPYNRTDPFSGQ